jgi:hypothetical protein
VGAIVVRGTGDAGPWLDVRAARLTGRSRWALSAALASALVLTGCGLSVSKNGLSGKAFGHSFSAAKGQLPSGFPKAVPSPADSRVLVGGGADSRFDVAYAVKGTVDVGTAAYQSTLQSAGFAISNVQNGSTHVTEPVSAGSTSTTVTLTGSTFAAKDGQWTVEVASGTSSSIKGVGLKAGEFALNVTVEPATSGTTTTG